MGVVHVVAVVGIVAVLLVVGVVPVVGLICGFYVLDVVSVVC